MAGKVTRKTTAGDAQQRILTATPVDFVRGTPCMNNLPKAAYQPPTTFRWSLPRQNEIKTSNWHLKRLTTA